MHSGSGHALLGLRADWRQQLTQQQQALGWRYVRFHGILDDDMSVLQMRDGKPLYSFFNIDSIYDFLLSINMKPIIELGFMPEDIASGNATVFHYKGNTTPPKSNALWFDLIQTLVKHLIDRYGIEEVRTWPFEVWNEPNCGFFSGTQQQYYELLAVTYRAIKSVDLTLSVGGPATCASGWINETLAWESSTGITLDFISTHMYPTDWGDNVPRDIVYQTLSNVRRTIGSNRKLYYTEYNSGLWCCPQIQHDTPYAAAFVVATLPRVYGLVDILSYWEFSDIFEEGGFDSSPFQSMYGSRYGLETIYNIPKPAYRAFELMHWSGSSRLQATQTDPNENVQILATQNATHINVYLVNFATRNHSIETETITVTVAGASVQSSLANLYVTRIDENNANPINSWIAMGSPMYPTKAQNAAMYAASLLVQQPLPFNWISTSSLSFKLDVPPLGVALVAIPLM
jgi:xylan 1,4-beta-xylosidase